VNPDSLNPITATEVDSSQELQSSQRQPPNMNTINLLWMITMDYCPPPPQQQAPAFEAEGDIFEMMVVVWQTLVSIAAVSVSPALLLSCCCCWEEDQ
jgi:hypothetical protein